jgi:hypothetical protein
MHAIAPPRPAVIVVGQRRYCVDCSEKMQAFLATLPRIAPTLPFMPTDELLAERRRRRAS